MLLFDYSLSLKWGQAYTLFRSPIPYLFIARLTAATNFLFFSDMFAVDNE